MDWQSAFQVPVSQPRPILLMQAGFRVDLDVRVAVNVGVASSTVTGVFVAVGVASNTVTGVLVGVGVWVGVAVAAEPPSSKSSLAVSALMRSRRESMKPRWVWICPFCVSSCPRCVSMRPFWVWICSCCVFTWFCSVPTWPSSRLILPLAFEFAGVGTRVAVRVGVGMSARVVVGVRVGVALSSLTTVGVSVGSFVAETVVEVGVRVGVAVDEALVGGVA